MRPEPPPLPMKRYLPLAGITTAALLELSLLPSADAASITWAKSTSSSFDFTLNIESSDVGRSFLVSSPSPSGGHWIAEAGATDRGGGLWDFNVPHPGGITVSSPAGSTIVEPDFLPYPSSAAGTSVQGSTTLPSPAVLWDYNLNPDGTGTIRVYWNASGGGGQSVPSGGPTALILGAALLGMAGVRRWLAKS